MSVEGNKNAEKYTVEFILATLAEVLETLEAGDEPTYTHALRKHRLNTHQVNEWLNQTHKDNKTVSTLIKRVKHAGEDSLLIATFDDVVKPAVGIFVMKAQYGWVEKGVELEVDAQKSVLKIVSVKADGTRVER